MDEYLFLYLVVFPAAGNQLNAPMVAIGFVIRAAIPNDLAVTILARVDRPGTIPLRLLARHLFFS
jgi:hypothetical protein